MKLSRRFRAQTFVTTSRNWTAIYVYFTSLNDLRPVCCILPFM